MLQEVLHRIKGTPLLAKIMAESNAEMQKQRQALVDERQRLGLAPGRRLPPLRAAEQTAREKRDVDRQKAETSAAAHSVAYVAMKREIASAENQRNRIDCQLRASADPAIEEFVRELRDRAEYVRLHGPSGGRREQPDGRVHFYSNADSVTRTLAALRDAQQATEALALEAVADLPAAIAGIRSGIPSVEDPVDVGEGR